MNLIPKWPFVAAALVFGLLSGAAGMRVWDKDIIADLHLQIANLQKKQAEDISKASQAALTDLMTATAKVTDAAEAGQVNVTALNTKLDAINRRIANAKPAPLPVDCKPGTERVRNLSESAAALNSAIARQIPSK